jgi:type IV pilus assembly protein PilY1
MDNDGDGFPDQPGETDPDIGYSFSQAYVVKTNATNAAHQWVVIFGNGYSSNDAKAVLYILDLDGVIIRKIDTGVSGDNGLSTPAIIDVNNDQKVDYVYAGDLKGNMWKFDLTADDADNWTVAFNDGTDHQPLFAAGPTKPITAKPDVMRHCTEHGYMVVFGTGRYLHNDDRADLSTQTIYGVWDYGDDADDLEYLGSHTPTGDLPYLGLGASLLQQTVIDVRTIDGHLYRTFSDNTANWNTHPDLNATPISDPSPDPIAHVGWYVDFPNVVDTLFEGERVFKNVMIRDGKAGVNSFAPDISPCSGGGNSFKYIMDACDGSRLSEEQFQGIWVNIGTADDPILVPPTGKAYVGILHEAKIIRIPGTGLERYYMSSSTGVVETEDLPAERRGMLYWQER